MATLNSYKLMAVTCSSIIQRKLNAAFPWQHFQYFISNSNNTFNVLMSLKITHVAKQNAENIVTCFHSNNGSVNTPQCTIIHIIAILFDHLHNYTFFQQDSAKAHTANNSMPCLERFATRIVRRGLLPPHFPDLNLRDFYLLGMWTMRILVTVTMKTIWKERQSTYKAIW
jgi:hypothetical protein